MSGVAFAFLQADPRRMQRIDKSPASLDEKGTIVSPEPGAQEEADAAAGPPSGCCSSLRAVARLLARAAARDWLGQSRTIAAEECMEDKRRPAFAPSEPGRKRLSI